MKKEYYIQFFKSAFVYSSNEEEGFFGGFEGESHIIVKRKQNAKLMSKKEARIVGDKLHRWNCPISFEVKTDVLVLGI
jgi:hypothetical protein